MRKTKAATECAGNFGMVMRILVILFLLFAPAYALADDCVSGASGNWNAAGNWNTCGGGFPEVGDTATITAGHTITLKVGASAVGTSPASTTTYDLDINGTLVFENVAAAHTLAVYSSIRVGATGVFRAGTSGSPFNCSGSARLTMMTSAASQKYTIYLNAGGTLDMHGCTTYHGSTATLTRARIASCAPDCTAGAVTVTLDRTHGWVASDAWSGDGMIVGVGGNETTMHASGDDPELITTWTTPGATTIGITFIEDHMVGDIVEIVRRNVLLDSDSASYHPAIYTSNDFHDPYSLSYIRIDEFGDSTSANYNAVNMNSSTYTLGSIDYVAVTNVEDGGATGCFYLNANSWTSFEGNTCFDARAGGYMYSFSNSTEDSTSMEFKNCSGYGSSLGNPTGIYATGSGAVDVDGFWCSHAYNCINNANGHIPLIKNSVFHGCSGDCVNYSGYAGFYKNETPRFIDNEFRNVINAELLEIGISLSYLEGNDFDGATYSCVKWTSTTSVRTKIRSFDNTFDRCNTADSIYAGVTISLHSANVYMNNELFGQTTANLKQNITWDTPQNNQFGGVFKGVCNNCLFAAATGASACGSMPTDGIYLTGCSTGAWLDAAFIDDHNTFTLHNKDQVEDDHIGWGPGGMIFSRQTGTVYTTSNLKMKITPCSTTEYKWIRIGSVYIADATALTVDLALRKDTSIATAGWRPRLALDGCGFNRIVDYDEMSDVDNTWELVQVTGTSTWKGVVHIYVGVRGVLDGANDYQAEWPPTLDVYADGLVVTK